MKLTKNNLLALVKEFVADVELVEDDNTEAVKIEDAKSALNMKLREALTPVIEQELKPKHRDEVKAEFSAQERKAIADAYGIERKLLEGLNHKDMIKIAKEAHEKNLKLDVNEWNKEREDMANRHTADKDAWENEKTQLNQQWQTKISERDVTEGLMKVLEAIPRKGGEISEQAEMLRFRLNKDGYEARYNPEKRAVELYKENQIALKDQKVLKIDDYAKDWSKSAGIFAEGTQHVEPTKLPTGTPSAATGKNAAYGNIAETFGWGEA